MESTPTRTDTMYSPVGTTAKTMWPMAALCCLGIIAFLIASTIILALIPVYISKKTLTVANLTNSGDQFYSQYSANTDSSSSISGTLNNLNDIGSSLNLGSSGYVSSGSAAATMSRRRRDLGTGRHKRQLSVKFVINITLNYSKTCVTYDCRASHRSQLRSQLSSSNFSNVPLNISTYGGPQVFRYNLGFVGLVEQLSLPTGFPNGTITSLNFVAVKSGPFNDPTVWANGFVPFGNCSVSILVGVTVSLPFPALEIKMRQCDIYGSLSVGSNNPNFTFDYPVNIVVRNGGQIQDMTKNKRLLLPQNSIMTMLPGGGFSAAGSVLQTYSSSGPGPSVTMSSASGPFTCGALPDGTIQSYNSVTFIAIKSGGFTSGGTFLGGFAPSSDMCSGGCGVQVQSGVTLSTADLNGVMSLNINSINVPAGAVLQLGTPGSTGGFKFQNPVALSIGGTMNFAGSGGAIMLPPNSNFGILAGGAFVSGVSASIQVFDPTSGAMIGSPQSLGFSINGGAYQIAIGIGGGFTISGTGPGATTVAPGGTGTTTQVPYSTAFTG